MIRRDFTSQRLFVRAAPRRPALDVDLDRGQANYLVNVLRLGDGDAVLVFNGRDGEWRASSSPSGRKAWHLDIVERTLAPQPPAPDLHYLFAPLKQARLDYMVEKAVEMGAGRLRPVLTQHTQVTRVNLERMEANAIEAAEQCGILSIPAIDEPVAARDAPRRLAGGRGRPPDHLLRRGRRRRRPAGDPRRPAAVAARRPHRPGRRLLRRRSGRRSARRPSSPRFPLGPRILRADTAAVAALALVQAVLGDWRKVAARPRLSGGMSISADGRDCRPPDLPLDVPARFSSERP